MDYKYNLVDTIPQNQIKLALQEAGWEIAISPSENSVTTANREIRNWLIYKVVVYMEVVPIGPKHVRLLIHPYRVFVTGTRSKIPFLKSGIRRRVINDINLIFESYDIVAVGEDL